MQIAQHPSPNCGPRRDGLTPTLIVLHYTAMRTAQDAIERLCDPAYEVSAHYVISKTGDVVQLVAEDKRAWHAGAGEWAGQNDINSRSIGIELDNGGMHPFPEPQMASLELLLRQIHGRWPIAQTIGHSDMAPVRKVDPGPHFDWARLMRQGLARGLESNLPPQVSAEQFVQAAQRAGFTADAAFEDLLATTRLRCAPWRTGPLDLLDFLLPVE